MPAFRTLLPLCVVVAACSGPRLPEELRTVRAAALMAPPTEAWSRVEELAGKDEAAVRAWRTDLRALRRASDVRGHAVWDETTADGDVIRWETVEVVGGRKLVRCIVPGDDGAIPPIGGCVTWEVAPRDDGSTVVLTEQARFHDTLLRWRGSPEDRAAGLEATLTALATATGAPPLTFAGGLREVRKALQELPSTMAKPR